MSKARRGELRMGLPVGLVYDPAGNVVLDPDAGVQQALRHLFATFARTGSASAVVHEFTTGGLLFPVRVRKGEHKGELAWTPLRHHSVLRVLHNPRYAGAFVYGRHRETTTTGGKKTSQLVPREQWTAFFPDSHPGYISLDQYELNQKLLAANAQAHGEDRTAGPAREGTALLQGLAICGKCGNRMTVRYHTRRGVEVPDYQCMSACIRDAGRRCQGIPGAGVDTAIGQLLLQEVTPMALEVALTVAAELTQRADEADTLRRQQVQRARQRVDLARRRYLAVDPDNRLVADTLEADWNDALRAAQTAQDDYDKASAENSQLSEQQQARIRALANDEHVRFVDERVKSGAANPTPQTDLDHRRNGRRREPRPAHQRGSVRHALQRRADPRVVRQDQPVPPQPVAATDKPTKRSTASCSAACAGTPAPASTCNDTPKTARPRKKSSDASNATSPASSTNSSYQTILNSPLDIHQEHPRPTGRSSAEGRPVAVHMNGVQASAEWSWKSRPYVRV